MSRHLVDDQLGQGTHTACDTTESREGVRDRTPAPAAFIADRFHEEEAVGHVAHGTAARRKLDVLIMTDPGPSSD